jgi:signal transduction histidine kinase
VTIAETQTQTEAQSQAERRRVVSTLRGLESRLVLASFVFAILIASVFGALILAVSGLRDATKAEVQAQDRTVKTLSLEKLVLDVEAGMRGYALTRNRSFLIAWRDSKRTLDERLKTFEEQFSNGLQRRRARAVTDQIRAYVNDYSTPIVNLVQSDPASAASARSPDAALEDRRRIRQVRQQFTSLLDAERQAAAKQTASADDRSRQAIVGGIVGLTVSALLIVLFGAFLARSIARPLRAAAAAASQVAGGDLTTRLEETGPGEVGDLARSFNDMTERLAERNAQLAEQNARLRESERLKAELISIVSHELRTPLASVLGFTSLLLQRDFDDAERRRYLGIIDAQSRRLAELLNDFLDAQRVEEGRLEMSFEPLDLASLLREQAQLFAGQSEAHEIRLDLDNEPFLIVGDRDRLGQVLANLLSNAIKYSPDGGVVELVGERENGVVRVQVRDEGRGIPRAEQPRIFTKFFRGDAGASGIGGTGLGLALAREIVEAHGGHIGFKSEAGSGSTFWFEVPTDRGPETN